MRLYTMLLPLISVPVACALGQGLFLAGHPEYPVTARENNWENDLLVPPSVVRDGEMVLPEGPGLGFELNEKLLASRQLGR